MNDVAFEPVAFSALPGWQDDDHAAALKAFLASCGRIRATPEPAAVWLGNVPVSLALLRACNEAREAIGNRRSAEDARRFFEHRFEPHRVVHNAGQGLLTGYYEPVVEGSRTPTERFRVALHRRPSDLVNVVDDSMRGASDGLTHVRQTINGFAPYPTRAEIDTGALAGKGLELVYLADAVEAFFMHVQGSGRIKLPDGSTMRVTYDGKNGHPYTSIGRHLIQAGLLAADRVSLDALVRWLRADDARARDVMWKNASYVFFRELVGEDATGAHGVFDILLTPGRSLAVDAGIHAIGTPIYVAAATLKDAIGRGPFQRLMIAQDVGSAIKGPERGDIYFGSGKSAGRRAGHTNHPGNFYVLLPRRAAVATTAGAKAGALQPGKNRPERPPEKPLKRPKPGAP